MNLSNQINLSQQIKRDIAEGTLQDNVTFDAWAYEYFPKLFSTGATSVVVGYEKFDTIPGLSRKHTPMIIVSWLSRLGFTVKYDCDDRPCATPYYRISLGTT